jgi:ATP-dependent DNA helicase RecG
MERSTDCFGYILICGIDPRPFIPGVYVQFVRLDEISLDAPIINQMEINGPFPQCLRNLNAVLVANLSTSLFIPHASTDVRHPDYRIKALQQLTTNAVMHRSYDGTHAPVRIYWVAVRIEIISPGGPFGVVTAEIQSKMRQSPRQ